MFCYNCMRDKGEAAACPYCGLDNSMEPASHHLRPGTVLARKYTVGYVIGEGGFGITYIGRDSTLDMRVAVKEYYPSGYATRSGSSAEVSVSAEKNRNMFTKGRERFLLEARNVAKFSSLPGIVDVRDYFEENGTAYIIMEYLDGMDLSRCLKTYGPMEAAKAFRLMLPVMRSLEKINAAGIIHRDISPDNIMFLSDGTLKLMDFGSARYYLGNETEMSVLLKQGYAPEEQYRKNGRQGPWTDVYGLCATLYRIITGQVPTDALDRLHDDDLQPPSELGVKISPPLEKVLMYGLAVFSENRCPDMGRLIALTEKTLAGNPVRTEPAMPGGDMVGRHYSDAGYKSAVEDELDDTGYGDSYTSGSGAASTAANTGEKPPKKNTGLIIVIIVIIAAMILGGAATALILGSGGKSAETPTEAETQAETVKAEAPEIVRITDVVGMKLDSAMSALRLQGMDVRVVYEASDAKRDHVFKMSPEAGSELEKGSTVTLYIPDEKVTEAPTQAPTEAPTENDTYVCIGVGGALFHKDSSRVSDCYDMTIPSGGEVRFIGESVSDMLKVNYNGAEGWVLSRLFAQKGRDAETVNDREYNEPLVCTNDTTLYNDPKFKSGTDIKKGESAAQVGYCQGASWDDGDDYYEIYYNGKIYYLPFSRLHDDFEYSTTW